MNNTIFKILSKAMNVLQFEFTKMFFLVLDFQIHYLSCLSGRKLNQCQK